MKNTGIHWHKWGIIGVLYAIVLMAVFAPTLFWGKSLYSYADGRPYSQIGGNESIINYIIAGGTYWDAGASDWIEIPIIEEMRNSIRKGESILWDAYNSLGIPVIPNSSAATMSPFEIVPILFQGEWAWNFLYLFRLWFLMLFSYAFFKELGLSDSISFFCGCISGLFGYSMYHMNMWHFNVDVVLPLLMFMTARFIRTKSVYCWGGLCLSIAVMMLGGNPQNLITGMALAHIFCIARVMTENCSWRKKVEEYVKYCFAYVLAACWTMFFWFPFLELFANGYNYHAGGGQGLFSVPVKNLLGFLFPGIYFDNGQFNVYLCYIGVGVLPIIFLYTNLKDKRVWIFIGFAVVYLLKILGFPLVQWIGRLPVFSMVNYWKYSFSFYFSIIIIFSYALENLKNESFESKTHRIKRCLISIYYLAMVVIVVGSIIKMKNSEEELSVKVRTWIPFLAFLAVAWLLMIVLSNSERLLQKNIFIWSTIICISIEILVVYGYLNNFRIDSGIALDNEVEDFEIVKSYQENDYERIAAIGIICMGNLSSNYGLYNISGYTAVPVSYYYEFMKELVYENQLDINFMVPVSTQYFEKSNKYFDLMGVSIVIMESMEALESDTLQMVYENGNYRIYKNEDYFDKAFYVYDYEQFSDKEEIFKFLDQQPDLSQKVAIESDDELSFSHCTSENTEDSVKIAEYADGRIRLNCNSNTDGFLVLNDLYYPGWRVYVDGKEQEIYKTDYIFRSVYLQSGEHEVIFIYKPISFYVGVLISGISVLGYIIFLIIKSRSRRKCANFLEMKN